VQSPLLEGQAELLMALRLLEMLQLQ